MVFISFNLINYVPDENNIHRNLTKHGNFSIRGQKSTLFNLQSWN